jgi:hypothetical protein
LIPELNDASLSGCPCVFVRHTCNIYDTYRSPSPPPSSPLLSHSCLPVESEDVEVGGEVPVVGVGGDGVGIAPPVQQDRLLALGLDVAVVQRAAEGVVAVSGGGGERGGKSVEEEEEGRRRRRGL